MFVLGKIFQASLIFASKLTQVKHLPYVQIVDEPEKSLPETNTLAYFVPLSVTKKEFLNFDTTLDVGRPRHLDLQHLQGPML